jgi:hypothetical protein
VTDKARKPCDYVINQTGWGEWRFGFAYRTVYKCLRCNNWQEGFSTKAEDPAYTTGPDCPKEAAA